MKITPTNLHNDLHDDQAITPPHLYCAQLFAPPHLHGAQMLAPSNVNGAQMLAPSNVHDSQPQKSPIPLDINMKDKVEDLNELFKDSQVVSLAK